ncbi:2-isopropylmalate synthase [bacterium BMS3Abin02]|nr:2-isopropylmalate synthase [bacterium BMS3Abin02]
MIDRSRVWTGTLNEEAIDRPLGHVGIYDTSLRDGEQAVGCVLGAELKLEIARALDTLGVDRIEAGFPRVTPEDARAYELIMADDLDAEIWGFSRAVPADVEQLTELGVRFAVVEAPISDGKLAAYGLDRAKVTERVVRAVEHAAGHDVTVCFFGVDGSRADPAFMERIYRAAVDAGAAEVAMVDTLGIASPEAVTLLIERCRAWIGPDIPIHWHGHNDFGLAVAGSLAAVRAGATWVQGSINGMGERAGNTDLGEFALALEALYGGSTRLRFDRMTAVADLIQELSGYDLAPWKAVTGRNLFVRESGAVAMQFHEPAAVEPYSSELVGAERGIVLGKKSGIVSIRIKAAELGIDLPVELEAAVLADVKALGSAKRDLVTDAELRHIVAHRREQG